MQTEILWPWELQDLTDKTVVVIDVWAATSNIALMLGKGAEQITVVNKENVIQAKEANKDAVVVGEHFQFPPDFFDYSNYPVDVNKIPPASKILYMTTNGAYVIEQALSKNAKTVTTGSILNFDAICQYLKRENPAQVILIPSGAREKGNNQTEEDLLCAEMFSRRIHGEQVEMDDYVKRLKNIISQEYGAQSFDEEINFDIIFRPNEYNVVPICTKEEWVLIKDLNAQRSIGQ